MKMEDSSTAKNPHHSHHSSASHQTEVSVDVHDVHVANRNDRKQMLTGMLVCCMPCYWLRTNTSLHKASLTVVTLLVTSLLVASPVLFLISSVPANEQPSFKECNVYDDESCLIDSTIPDVPLSKCDSLVCKDIARKLRHSLSWEYDPCRNFYNFACGGWSEHEMADPSLTNNLNADISFTTLQKKITQLIQNLIRANGTYGRFKKVGDFYSSCMWTFDKPNEQSRMYATLDQLGGYLPPGSLAPNDLTPLMLNILNVSGTPLLDLSITRIHSRFFVIIGLPDGITDKLLGNFYEPENIFNRFGKYYEGNIGFRLKRDTNVKTPYEYIKEKRLEKYVHELEKIVLAMLPKRMDQMAKYKEVQQILLFASTVKRIIPGRKYLRDEVPDYSENSSFTVQKLQEDYPLINWQELLSKMIRSFEKENMRIFVTSPTYFKSLMDVIPKFQHRIIHNALLAMYARDFLYYAVNVKRDDVDDIQTYCTSIVIYSIPFPISALYVGQYSQEYLKDIEERGDEMFANLKLALFKRVEKATWIDNDSRWKVMDRITQMKAGFLAWPGIRNTTSVDKFLTSMRVSDDFYENILNHYKLKRQCQLNTDENIPVDSMWYYPFSVNAYYDAFTNRVEMPLALLSQVYFSRGVPSYISYASIGTILAHEMLHGLDYSTLNGNKVTPLWKDSVSRPALETKLSCVIDNYHMSLKKDLTYLGKDIQIKLDGNLTLDETVADLTSIQVAWSGWRQLPHMDRDVTLSTLPLPPSRLFFLTLSQFYCTHITVEDHITAAEERFHLLSPERVNGLTRNMYAFAESFQCSSNSPMNPSNKCTIW